MEKCIRTGIYFNPIDGNCAAFAANVLKMAGIEVDNKEHVSQLLWKLLLPKWFRESFGKIDSYIQNYFPHTLKPVFNLISKMIGHLLLCPAFSLLGGWWAHHDVPKANEGASQRNPNGARPFFSSLFDFVDSAKMSFRTTLRLREWQKEQGERTKYFTSS